MKLKNVFMKEASLSCKMTSEKGLFQIRFFQFSHIFRGNNIFMKKRIRI